MTRVPDGARTVWKYQLEDTLEMPEGARILTAAVQVHGRISMWAAVDPDAPVAIRRFRTVGTGRPLPTDVALAYVATVLMNGGDFAYHVFEEV